MVRAESDVANAVEGVCTYDGEMALRRRNFDIRLRSVNDGGPGTAIQEFHANQNVGDGGLQTGKLDASSIQ